mgnify:CR=1 FL=1
MLKTMDYDIEFKFMCHTHNMKCNVGHRIAGLAEEPFLLRLQSILRYEQICLEFTKKMQTAFAFCYSRIREGRIIIANAI